MGMSDGQWERCILALFLALKFRKKAEIRFRTEGASSLCMKVVSDPGWISIKKLKLLSEVNMLAFFL